MGKVGFKEEMKQVESLDLMTKRKRRPEQWPYSQKTQDQPEETLFYLGNKEEKSRSLCKPGRMLKYFLT